MASTHFERARREQERILKGLERKHDKAGIPLRQYTTDLANIQKLLTEKVIDRDHADLLAQNVHNMYEAYQAKGRAEKLKVKLVAEASHHAIVWFFLTVVITLAVTLGALNKLFG
jgi:hypothetical protein